MNTLKTLQHRLASTVLEERVKATWDLCHRPNLVEALFNDLVQAIRDSSLRLNDEPKAAHISLTFGVMALSNYLKNAARRTEIVEEVEREMIRLANSKIEALAGTTIFWIGQLHQRGLFAWNDLKALATKEDDEGAGGNSETIRAFAYRALLSTDEARTMSLGNIRAKSDLHNALMGWMAQTRSESAIREFEQLLEVTALNDHNL